MPYVLMCFNAKEDPQYTQVLKTIYPEKVPIREELHKHVFGESLDPKVHEWLKGANHDPYSIVAHDGTVYWWAEYLEVKQAKANSWYDRANVNLDEVAAANRAAPELQRMPTLHQALMDGRVPQVELGYDDDEWRRPTHVGMGAGMYQMDGVSKLFWHLLWALLAFLLAAVVFIQIGIAAGWFPRGNR